LPHNLAGISTAQQVATVKKYSAPISFISPTCPIDAQSVVVTAANMAAMASEPHNSATCPRNEGTGRTLRIGSTLGWRLGILPSGDLYPAANAARFAKPAPGFAKPAGFGMG